MSVPYETGPVEIYAAVNSTFPANPLLTYPQKSEIRFVGTGEIAPDIIKQTKFDPVFNDIGGSLPFDYLFQGEEALIPITLTKFNWTVLTRMNSMPNPRSGQPGYYQATDTGTLMVTEGLAYHFWMHFPYYSNKTIFSTAGMVAGYHFWATWTEGPFVVQGGTKANKIRLNQKCVRVYQPASNNNGWYLFDHDMTSIPYIPPTTSDGILL